MADKKPDRIKNAAVAETIKIKGHKKRWIEKRTIDIEEYGEPMSIISRISVWIFQETSWWF